MLVCHGGPKGSPVGFEGRVFKRGDRVNADGKDAQLETDIRSRPWVFQYFSPAEHEDTDVAVAPSKPFVAEPFNANHE